MEARRFEEGNRVSSWAIFDGEVARAYVPRTDDPAEDERLARLFAIVEEMEPSVRYHSENGCDVCRTVIANLDRALARLDGEVEQPTTGDR